ncbi:MAG: hypothetical protein K2J02_02465 [Malacoplasma sp.]|nr:hypothetical protein [Malacoplasma sp.]MDE5949491.1 hypothetical protein [Malacoplasma sp.]MDE6894221.1 hypothetical protein [Malacoplasma sp.]
MKDKNLYEISLLIDFYGKLLTEKQLQNITDYYFNDLSLSEIAQNNNVSRVAIYDSIRKSKSELDEFEKKLGFIKKFNLRKKLYENIKDENLKKELLHTEVTKLWNPN